MPEQHNGTLQLLNEHGRMRTLEEIEQEAIDFAIEHEGRNMCAVASALGIGRSTLYRKIRLRKSRAEGLADQEEDTHAHT